MQPIRIIEEAGVLIVRLAGRLSQQEGESLVKKLAGRPGSGCPGLLLDLSEVEYMTSSAVGAVVSLCQQVRLGGGRMAVAAPDDRVHMLLEVAGLNQLLALCRSAEEARRALAAGAPPQ
jgi:anti-sigma B factor antagonist